MRFHLEENESRNSEREETEVDEGSSSDSKIVRAIKKKTSSARKAQQAIKQKVLLKLQIIVALAIVVIVVMWAQIENFLQWASGSEEIAITEKSTDNGCYEIITSVGESYCVEKESYEMATEGYNYLIEETQYSFRLRMVK